SDRKQFFLERTLEGKATEMFRVAPEVNLEHSVYEGVKRGTLQSADDLDALSRRIYAAYVLAPERHDELSGQWMNVGFMYQEPFYDANYIFGAMLALEFREMLSRDPESFVRGYIGLMKNGFDAPPASLLKRFLGLDLQDPSLVERALGVVEEMVDR